MAQLAREHGPCILLARFYPYTSMYLSIYLSKSKSMLPAMLPPPTPLSLSFLSGLTAPEARIIAIKPYTLHPTPCTLHPTPQTPHPWPHRRRGQRGWQTPGPRQPPRSPAPPPAQANLSSQHDQPCNTSNFTSRPTLQHVQLYNTSIFTTRPTLQTPGLRQPPRSPAPPPACATPTLQHNFTSHPNF
jgi:hypothetical protein